MCLCWFRIMDDDDAIYCWWSGGQGLEKVLLGYIVSLVVYWREEMRFK